MRKSLATYGVCLFPMLKVLSSSPTEIRSFMRAVLSLSFILFLSCVSTKLLSSSDSYESESFEECEEGSVNLDFRGDDPDDFALGRRLFYTVTFSRKIRVKNVAIEILDPDTDEQVSACKPEKKHILFKSRELGRTEGEISGWLTMYCKGDHHKNLATNSVGCGAKTPSRVKVRFVLEFGQDGILNIDSILFSIRARRHRTCENNKRYGPKKLTVVSQKQLETKKSKLESESSEEDPKNKKRKRTSINPDLNYDECVDSDDSKDDDFKEGKTKQDGKTKQLKKQKLEKGETPVNRIPYAVPSKEPRYPPGYRIVSSSEDSSEDEESDDASLNQNLNQEIVSVNFNGINLRILRFL